MLSFVQNYFRDPTLPSALSRWTPHYSWPAASHKSRAKCSCVTNSQRHSPLMHLPPELILYIALFVPKRYEPRRGQSDYSVALAKSDLTALASVCKSLRQVLLPVLFANVTVHTSTRLTALSKAPDHILALVRTFTVQLDLDFYETWIWSLDHRAPSTGRPTSSKAAPTLPTSSTSTPSPKRLQSHASTARPATTNHQRRSTSDPVYALAYLLVRTAPTLRSFRFVMHSRPTSSGSAWSQFPRPGMAGIPFGGHVVAAMESFVPAELLTFPELRNLELDGTADVRPVLAMTPGLTSLRLRIPEGFNATDCASIVHSLPLVPKLRLLEMWVWELASASTASPPSKTPSPTTTPAQQSTTQDSAQLIQRERVRLLTLIGQACPNLEWLGFQTRSFDYADGGMGLRVVGEKGFDWKDLVSALAHFPTLRELHLPGTLHSQDERYALELNMKSAFESSSPPTTTSISPPPSPTTTRMTPLERIELRERETSALLFRSSAGPLSRIGWVRAEGLVGVEYTLLAPSPPSPSSSSSDLISQAPAASTLAYATREYKSKLFDPEWWDEETQLLWDDDRSEVDDLDLDERKDRERRATNAASLTAQLRDLGEGMGMLYRAVFPPSNRPRQFRASSAGHDVSSTLPTTTTSARSITTVTNRRRAPGSLGSRRATALRAAAPRGFDPHFYERGAGVLPEMVLVAGVESLVFLVFTSSLVVASWRTLVAAAVEVRALEVALKIKA